MYPSSKLAVDFRQLRARKRGIWLQPGARMVQDWRTVLARVSCIPDSDLYCSVNTPDKTKLI